MVSEFCYILLFTLLFRDEAQLGPVAHHRNRKTLGLRTITPLSMGENF